jgi:hypothetical protein
MFQPNMEAEGFFSIFPRAFMIHTWHVNMFQVTEFLQAEVYPVLEKYKGKIDKPAILEI